MAFWRGELIKVIAQVKAIPSVEVSIHGADEATTPADADEFALADSANGFVLKKITWANIKVTLNAIYNWATVTHAATGKTTPAAADEFSIVDSAASNVIKKLTWANLKAAVYAPGGIDVVVADGGTGVSSLTAYALLAGGTTSTGPVQSLAGLGSATQVLTSNGAGALPTFQAIPAQGWAALGTITTTSGSSQALSGLTLTSYKFLRCYLNGVSGSNGVGSNITQNSRVIAILTAAAGAPSGILEIDLSTGASYFVTGGTTSTTATSGGGPSGVTTGSTSITFAISAGSFDAGSIAVYAI